MSITVADCLKMPSLKMGKVIGGKKGMGKVVTSVTTFEFYDEKLANEKDMGFLSVAVPSPVRLVMTTNYVGFSGGLRLIEDIYGKALDGYVK